MKRKMLASLAVTAVLVVGTLAGCQNGKMDNETTGSANQTETEGELAGDVTEITFWDQNASTVRTEIYSKLITDFEVENPDIKVNFVPIPAEDAKAKYDVAIQSNTAPDCGGVSQYWMSDFIIQDALYPLDDYIGNWAEKDNMLSMYAKSIVDMSPDGKTYALAHTVTLPAVWYNANILKEASVEIPKTWDDVLLAVEKTSNADNGVYGFSIRGGAGSSQQFEQMMYQYSGELNMFDENGLSTANDPDHVTLLENFADIYNKYTPESDITNGYAEMVSAFDTQSAAMIFHNLGSYGEHKKTLGEGNFGALTSLTSTDGKNVIISNGAICLSVFKNSKHPEEAFRFISYLCEQNACSYFNEQIGQIPCNTEALKDSWIEAAPHLKTAADSLLDADVELATLPINITGYYDLHSNVLTEGFQQVLLGNMTAQEYLDNWADEMTALKTEYDAYIVSSGK